MLYFADNIRNNFDFFLRKKIKFSRKNYAEKNADLEKLLEVKDIKMLYEKLSKKYDLSLFKNLSERNFLENMYFLDLFNKTFTKTSYENLSVLDIGSKNWSYVKSQYLFFKTLTPNLFIDGIELDAYRLNNKFYSRFEIAKFYTKNLQNTNYIAADFMEHQKMYDYIIWILPFLTKYPILKWGLPVKYLKPKEMLIHACNLLKPEGELLIIN